MSTFDNKRVAKEEARKKNDMRREKLAGYFFDLSKLIFAGIVIGGLTPVFSSSTNEISWETIVIGVITTYIFASLANRILK
ncbi:hypothetical protein, membrane [gut metagenome]|uniref:Uncharacterized protein n=1 Tax=gut metagenome TaxID=749906 RepID=J9GEU0_9ZZZZ